MAESRLNVPDALKKEILARDNNQCVLCGAETSLLVTHFDSPFRPSTHGLATVCHNCHYHIDSGHIREFEFQALIESILHRSEKFCHIESHVTYADFGVDFSAIRGKEQLHFECRALFAFTSKRFDDLLSMQTRLARHMQNSIFVLVTLGRLSEQQKELLQSRGIEHWDPRYLVDEFGAVISEHSESVVARLIMFLAGKQTSREPLMLTRLKSCQPGKCHWSLYQRLIGEILESFFVPPLEKSILERSDFENVNRRDFIFPNYCTQGFWEFMRQKYSADFVVVDAKNYSDEIKKKEVLQIANYLKSHGTGLFGIIVCRKGAARSAKVTIREQWVLHRKLILVLDDQDLTEMVAASSSRGNPDTILRQRLEEFRLGM